MQAMELVEKEQMREDIPQFRAGDTVKLHARVIEGEQERIQVFEGVVMRRTGGAMRSSFTVRNSVTPSRSVRRLSEMLLTK